MTEKIAKKTEYTITQLAFIIEGAGTQEDKLAALAQIQAYIQQRTADVQTVE